MRLKPLLFLLLLLASCGRNKQREIAVIPKGTADVYFQSVHAGAVAAGRESNAAILWSGPHDQTEYSRQIEIIDSMIARHVDGLAIAATDRNALNASIDRAAAQKIPVAIFDSGVDSTNYLTFIATDNYAAGKKAGAKMGEILGGKGNVGMVMHAPGSSSTMDRERGFTEALAAFPGIKIVASLYSMSDRAKGLAATENILTAHPELAGIFASSEPSSVGAAQALKARNLAGKVKLVAFDSSEGLVADLKAGTVQALIVQDPFKMGYEAVKALIAQLDGKPPAKRVDLDATVITAPDLAKPEIHQLLFPDLKKFLD